MRPTAMLALAVLLAGCGAPAADDPEPAPRELAPTATAEELVGTLGGDARLEGGCVWLDTGDGRIEVLWPEGWTASADPVELRDPDDAVVAREGDEVRVAASPAPDLVSTCQVGELWRATAVAAG